MISKIFVKSSNLELSYYYLFGELIIILSLPIPLLQCLPGELEFGLKNTVCYD